MKKLRDMKIEKIDRIDRIGNKLNENP